MPTPIHSSILVAAGHHREVHVRDYALTYIAVGYLRNFPWETVGLVARGGEGELVESGERRPGGGTGAPRGGSGGSRSGGSRSGGSGRGRSDRPGGRPGGKPGGRPSTAGRPARTGERRQAQDSTPRGPRGPQIPEDIDITDLDPAVINELRTLPEDMRDTVAGHLLVAEQALLDEDTDLAKRHAAEAKRLAGRVACVREAMGIVAYRCGDYADALAELRAVRRMTGDDSFVPMMADCERGLGRPERALELLREARSTDPEMRVEAAIVAAGARSDMGQHEAALVLLDIPEMTSLPVGSARARLEYAYANSLEALGRTDEAREWFAKAAATDMDEVTDAAERLV